MTTVIAISDIHGNLAAFDRLAEAQTKYPGAITVFLGDYVDGNPDGFAVLTKIQAAQQADPAHTVVIKGNHDQMLVDYMRDGDDSLWGINGGNLTIEQALMDKYHQYFSGPVARHLLLRAYGPLIDWVNALPLTKPIDALYFVHAGLNMGLKDPLQETTAQDKIWVREEYIYAPGKTDAAIFAHNPTPYTIVTGHSPTVLIYGDYDGPNLPGYPNQIADPELPCPIKIIQYPEEKPRVFIDGGNHAGIPGRRGNVAVFDSKSGALIDKFEDD